MNVPDKAFLTQLVISAQNGDDHAFSELFHITCKKQCHYAQSIMNDPFLAEDIVQDVYLKLYKRLKSLKNPEAFLAFLGRMTYNECINYRRKKYYTAENNVEQTFLDSFEDETILPAPEKKLLDSEKSQLLSTGLKKLSEEECTALMLHYYEDMKLNEIADTMTLSLSTVKRRIQAAREKMAAYLSEQDMRGLLFVPAGFSYDKMDVTLSDILNQKTPTKKTHYFYVKQKLILAILLFIGCLCFVLAPATLNTFFTSQKAPVSENVEASSSTSTTILEPAEDTSPPQVVSYDFNDSTLYFYLSDNDSGIDYNSIYVLNDTGQKIKPQSVDSSTGCVNFLLSAPMTTLFVSDFYGNISTTPIDVHFSE